MTKEEFRERHPNTPIGKWVKVGPKWKVRVLEGAEHLHYHSNIGLIVKKGITLKKASELSFLPFPYSGHKPPDGHPDNG